MMTTLIILKKKRKMMVMTPVTKIMKKDLLKMGKENLTAVARELDSRAVFIERSSRWGEDSVRPNILQKVGGTRAGGI